MVRVMTPEEYARLFAPASSNEPIELNGHKEAPPVLPLGLDGAAPRELTEEEIELLSFKGYDHKFIRTDWQNVDLFHLWRQHDQLVETDYKNEKPKGNIYGLANWSEMGCYKTSTGLWLIERLLNEAKGTRKARPGPSLGKKAPSILVVTSKGGKGTFLEAVPEILPEFTIINVETQALFYYKNGHMLKLDPKQLKFIPKEFDMPVVCLAHYDIFSRSNFGKFETDEQGMPLKLDGKFLFKPWLQADYLIDREWDAVWCDEFHRLKDRDARWTVNIKKLKARIVKHGSTGTGFINRPDEIWSLLNFLQKDKYGSYWDFRQEFCEIDDWDGYAKVVGCKPEKRDEFRKIVRTIGVRRTLDQVMPHIKTPIYQPVTVELNKTQRKMYNDLKAELAALDSNGTPLYAANVLSLLQRLRQICVGTPEVVEDYYDPIEDRRVQKIKLREPSSKVDALMEVLEGLQWDDEKKEPLVVFSNFKDPLELFKARLDKHNENAIKMGLDDMLYKYIHLDVGDSDLERYHKWHDEFPKLEHRVFMSTLQLGGESINLTPARHVVFLDRSWSPKDNAQGIGRIRRPGQEGQPVVIHINALDTTDQYIERVNDIKHGWFVQIFGKE